MTITPSETAAGSYAVLTVSVGHGCEGSPTTKITIQVPEEITSVTPTRNPLWTIDMVLDEPLTDANGNVVTERVGEVTYTTDTPLPDGYRDTFELAVQLPLTPGATLAFPTIQTCAKGEAPWVEVPAEGQDADELERPAPTVTITEAAGDAQDDDAGTEDPAAQGESSDSVDSDALSYAGLGVGALGLIVGGTALARGRRTS